MLESFLTDPARLASTVWHEIIAHNSYKGHKLASLLRV